MANSTLKIVKSKKRPTKHFTNYQLPITNYQFPELSPAEQAEMARFRTFTKNRAALQARVRRLFTQVNEHQARKAA